SRVAARCREGAIPPRMAWPPTPLARPHPLPRSKPPFTIYWPRKFEVGSYLLSGGMILLFFAMLAEWSAADIRRPAAVLRGAVFACLFLFSWSALSHMNF